MPKKLSSFSSRQRPTKLPFRSWLTGEILQYEMHELGGLEPRHAANAFLTWAKRNDVAAVALPVRDHHLPGAPWRYLEVWGDSRRRWDDGPTPAIEADLRAAGWKPRRRSAS